MNQNKDEVHIVYYVRANRKAEDGHYDGGELKVHRKPDADALVKLFKDLGYQVAMVRLSEHRLIDEIAEDDDCGEEI